jgi:hypothetical protein
MAIVPQHPGCGCARAMSPSSARYICMAVNGMESKLFQLVGFSFPRVATFAFARALALTPAVNSVMRTFGGIRVIRRPPV